MTVALLVFLAVVTLCWAGFCAGMETAFLSVSRERVLHMARAGGPKARLVEAALADMARTTTTLLIGNNLANVIYSASTAALASALFAESRTANAVWSFLAAFTVLYVSEFMPKLLCAARPLRHALRMASSYRLMELALRPLTFVALRFTDFFVPSRESKYRLTAADLLRILQDRKDGVCLSDFESALISRLIVLRVKRQPITPEAILGALRDFE